MFTNLINRIKQRFAEPALLLADPPDEFAHQPGVSYECSSIDRTILMSEESEIPGCSTEFIALGSLASSPTNPRKSFDDATMAELAESVKQQGILQPILVRSWPSCYDWTGTETRTDLPRYEIVAGERRFRAAKMAGLERIPALVRWFSTMQVCEIQIVENLQRQDLHPLEEAEGYGLMMHEHGYSAEQLAEKIGKSRSYIFGRLKLLDLDTDSRRLFSGGLLNASTALLVARIPTSKLRAQAIKEITEKDRNEDSMSVREAQRWIKNRYMLKLADVSFPIDDTTLPGGSCSDCPKRTGNVRDLFDDIENPDVCTDPDCFGAKKLFVLERDVAKAKENGALVIVGKEAKKLAPYGIYDDSRLDDYTQLDNTCYDDKDSRSYREILGSSVETVLIEDTEHSRLVPMIPNTILAERLREAGIERQADKNARDKEKVQAKLAIERAYRERLFAEVRSTVSEALGDGSYVLPSTIETFILWRSARMMFDRLYGDSQSKIASLWKAPGKNATERNKVFIAETLPRMSTSELWRLLVDMTTIASVGVSEWTLDTQPVSLLDIALLLDIKPDEVRKSVVAETKTAKSETKAAKKAKKPTPDTAADHLYATEAAQAVETLRDDDPEATDQPFVVGDRVRVRDDIKGTPTWRNRVCGREGVVEVVSMDMVDVRVGLGIDGLIENLMVEEVERCPAATEAAQADDDTAEQNQTLPANAGIETNETPIAIETGAGNGVQDLIETNETPNGTGASQPAYRHPDDASLTWSGRGRRPAWIAACLSTGQALEDLKVAA